MSIPATKNGMPPIHPGELLEEILSDLGMSQAAFARVVGVRRCVFRTWFVANVR